MTCAGVLDACAALGVSFRQNTDFSRTEVCVTESIGALAGSGDWRELDDTLEGAIRAELQAQYRDMEGSPYTARRAGWDDAVHHAELASPSRPFRDYIRSVEWDGVNRIETALHDCLGVERSELNDAVSRLIFEAIAVRTLNPGYHFRLVPLLIGDQNIGKSRFIEWLVPESLRDDYFSDRLSMAEPLKDRLDGSVGKAVIEWAEMGGIKRADLESMKRFVSANTDRYRLSYGKRDRTFRRTFILIATADRNPLPDDHDNSRFVAVQCPGTGKAVEPWLDEWRDQLYAEAVQSVSEKLKAGKLIELPRELYQREANRAVLDVDDELASAVVGELNGRELETIETHGVKITDLHERLQNREQRTAVIGNMSNRYAVILKSLGMERRKVKGQSVWFPMPSFYRYRIVETPEAEPEGFDFNEPMGVWDTVDWDADLSVDAPAPNAKADEINRNLELFRRYEAGEVSLDDV